MSSDYPIGQLKVNSDGVTLSTAQKDHANVGIPGIRLWGHRLSFVEGSHIECEECEMSEEIPELLQLSSPFRQAVYKLYILGKFKEIQCEPEYINDESLVEDNLKYATTTTTNSGSSPFKTDRQYSIGTDDGRVITDGNVILDSTSGEYEEGDVLTSEDIVKLYQNWSSQGQTSLNKGVDTTTSTDSSVSPGEVVDEKSLKERLTSKVSDTVGL